MQIRDTSYTLPFRRLEALFGGGSVRHPGRFGQPLAYGHLIEIQDFALKTGSQPVMRGCWVMERNDETIQSLQDFADDALKNF